MFKSFTLFIFSISLLNSCKYKNSDNYYEIINVCFLSIVDSVACQYGVLRPPLGMEIQKIGNVNKSILLFPKLESLKKWSKHIYSSPEIFNKQFKLDSAELSSWKTIKSENLLNLSSFISTCGFKIEFDSSMLPKKSNRVAGHVKFSEILINQNNDRALTVVTVQDNIKSGISLLILLKKQERKWTIEYQDTFEIW